MNSEESDKGLDVW